MLRRTSVLVLASLLSVAACADDDGGAAPADPSAASSTTSSSTTSTTSTTTTVAPSSPAGLVAGRPHATTVEILTLVDPSRETPATDTTEPRPERTLEVWLHLPDIEGPVPLIVFSHGLSGHPDKFETLHEAWAAAGYAVAAPAFPLTNDDVPGSVANAGDVVNQPGDVSFVLDHLLAESADPSSALAGRFDETRVGAAGLSLGGATTYEVAINDLARDERFRAAIVMAGAAITSPDNGSFVAADVPTYLLHGDADPLIALEVPQAMFDVMAGPAYFTTLLGGGHAGPFEDAGGFEAKIPGMDEIVHASTIEFWDVHLLDPTGSDPVEREEAVGRITALAVVDGLSEIVVKPA